MRRDIAAAAALVATLWIAVAAQEPSGRQLLEAARKIEQVDGDLLKAIEKYQEIAARFQKTDRAVAVEALLSAAECYQALGNERAPAIFESIIRLFPDQPEAVRIAKARLARRPAAGELAPTPQMICEQCGDPYGSITPDGKLMASTFFSGDTQGDISIRSLTDGSSGPLRLVGTGKSAVGSALFPVFSPDARQIVYSWSTGRNKVELRVVNRSAGSAPRTLFSNPDYIYVAAVGWGPSGLIVALAQRPDLTWEILKLNANADGFTRLASLQWRIFEPLRPASLSPDGKYVAYEALATNPPAPLTRASAGSLDRQIYIIATDGSTQHTLTSGNGVKRAPIWSADGHHVLFTSDLSGTWDLWTLPTSDLRMPMTPVLVKKNIGEALPLSLSDNGTLYYWEGRSGIFRSSIVAADTTKRSIPAPTIIGTRPAWSPDGSLVALGRDRRDGGGPGIDIVVHSVGSGDERTFSRQGIADLSPLWTPDGKGLLVLARDRDQQSWYRVDLASGSFHRMIGHRDPGAPLTHPNVRALSPDGRTLYLGAYLNASDPDLDRIVAVDLGSGAARDVFRLPVPVSALPHGAQEFMISIRPDGSALALMFRDRDRELVRIGTVNVDGTNYREVTEPLQTRNLRNKLLWSRDGHTLYFSIATGQDVHALVRLDTRGGQMQPLDLEVEGLEAFDLSRDGERLIYSTLRPEGAGSLLWSVDVRPAFRSNPASPRRSGGRK